MLFAYPAVQNVFADSTTVIQIEDENAEFENSPLELDGVTLVPMQEFVSMLGAELFWNFEDHKATITLGSRKLELIENSELAYVDSEERQMPKKVEKYNSVLYVPLRFTAEELGYEVEWNGDEEKIYIARPKEIMDKGNYYDIVNVTCSDRQNDVNVETNVTDMDYNTRWSCETQGSYVTLELAEVSPVAYIGIAMYSGDERQSVVSIQISEDGENFKEVVTRYSTSVTLNMEPISLGGTYNAKYIRVLGYGNTINNWNSITELRVYAPYEDGSMPVDQSGPGGKENGSYDELSESEKAALEKLETCFDGVFPWLTNLYDYDEHGFYMTMSGKDDPTQHTGLEMTAWGINFIKNYSDMWTEMPESMRQKWIDYFNDRQDPKTGFYIDKQGPVNDRETARNQSAAYGAVTSSLKGKTRYVHPNDKKGTVSSTDTTVLPDYLATPESFVKWIESWNWTSNTWTAGDQISSCVQSYLPLLPKEKYDIYKQTLVDWLATHQKSNGLWSDKIDFNSISGLFKMGIIYNNLGMKIPNADTALDSIAKCFEVDSPTAAHYVRNPISVMLQIANYGPEYFEKVRKITADNIDIMLTYIQRFLCPDGGFSMFYQKSQSNFGGIYGSHQLWEGDIDSAMMIMVARNEMYKIFGITAPKLHMDGFWDILEGKAAPPNPYDEKYKDILYNTGTENAEEDFQSYELTQERMNEFGGNTVNSNLTAKIVMDKDRKDNKVLSLYYDGTQSGGPTMKIPLGSGGLAQIKYMPEITETKVVEFEVKLSGCSGSPNIVHIDLGSSNAYALNLQGSGGTVNLGSRVDDTNVAYGGNFTSIGANEWYKVKIEYKQGKSADDTDIKVYVDEELVYKGSNYSGVVNGGTPRPLGNELSVVYYRAGKGTLYLDNIKIYSK